MRSDDYENSSRGALFIRWPGVTRPGVMDCDHLVSTLDFAPTLLDAAGLPPLAGIDGRSFLPAVKGEKMAGWDRVFTFYNAAFGNRWLPMRCVRTKDRSYIWNAWSDGKREYHTENMAGLTWKAMLAAAATNPAIKERTEFYLHRVPEEFYDLTSDRCERANLIGDPSRQDNPLFPDLRSGHRLFQRPSPQKQIPSSNGVFGVVFGVGPSRLQFEWVGKIAW